MSESVSEWVSADVGVVDVVAIHEEENVCVLGLVDSMPWGDPARLKALEQRLNAYVAYWDSGQLVADFPAAQYASVKITVFLQEEPDADGVAFLARIAEAVRTLAIGFEYQMLVQ